MASRQHLKLLPSPTTATLRDGAHITIRALVPEDRELVAEAFAKLSARSRYMRFLTPLPSLSPRMLDSLMDVDHEHHLALIALEGGEAVGVVRFVRFTDEPDVADVAITVIDERQGRGLGRALLHALLDAAVERGVRALNFDIHPDNRVMARLATSLGTPLRYRDGLMSGRLEVAPRVALDDVAA